MVIAMIKAFIKLRDGIQYGSFFMIFILCIAVQSLVGNEALAETNAREGLSPSESWDRLLIQEVPSLKENVDNIVNALNEGNYSMASEQIDDIQTGDNWFNIRNELESRKATDIVYRFNNSLFELERLSKTEDFLTSAIEQAQAQAQMLSESMDDIVNILSTPVIDVQRLVLSTAVIGIVIGTGLLIIPRVREKCNIKF